MQVGIPLFYRFYKEKLVSLTVDLLAGLYCVSHCLALNLCQSYKNKSDNLKGVFWPSGWPSMTDTEFVLKKKKNSLWATTHELDRDLPSQQTDFCAQENSLILF